MILVATMSNVRCDGAATSSGDTWSSGKGRRAGQRLIKERSTKAESPKATLS